MRAGRLLRRHVLLPSDHGSWILLLSPLAIGIVAGWLEPSGRLRITALYLAMAAISAFLARQPLTLVVKILAGRRSREDLAAALFASAFYSVVAAIHVVGLCLRGFAFLLVLAIPGGLVFGWYLVLVGRREERRQIGLEILAAGTLALSAPAGLWLGLDRPDSRGWLLWILLWAQAAASLVHVYEQLVARRPSTRVGHGTGEPRSGRSVAVLLSAANVIGVCLVGIAGRLPLGLVVPYLLQLAEAAWRRRRAQPGIRPSDIGVRQMWVSVAFSVLFLVAWLSASLADAV